MSFTTLLFNTYIPLIFNNFSSISVSKSGCTLKKIFILLSSKKFSISFSLKSVNGNNSASESLRQVGAYKIFFIFFSILKTLFNISSFFSKILSNLGWPLVKILFNGIFKNLDIILSKSCEVDKT